MSNVTPLKSKYLYQFKISLDYTKPAIWRRFTVEPETKLNNFHKILQTIMGWSNNHMHLFRIDDKFYSAPCDDDFMETIDYSNIRLNALIKNEKQEFYYDYDFGDNWRHTVILEKIIPKNGFPTYPLCIKGKRNVPPEDCGGAPGYENILEIIKNPGNSEYEEIIDWLGDIYDPEEFEIDIINELLQERDYGCISQVV